MKTIFKKIEKQISINKNDYDIIRIVDILNKKSRIIKENNIHNLESTCYDIWKKGLVCDNCISTRAYYKKNIFMKIKSVNKKIFLVTAFPIYICEGEYVLETLKDISINNFKDIDYNTVIDKMNKNIVTDKSTKLYNNNYAFGRLPIDINTSVINKQILSIIMINLDFLNNIGTSNLNTIINNLIKDFSKTIYNAIKDKNNWISRYSETSFLIVSNNLDKETSFDATSNLESLLNTTFSKYKKLSNLKFSPIFSVYYIENEKVDISKILSNIDCTLNSYPKKNNCIIPAYTNIDEKNTSSSYLSREIEKLRSILNEMCITTDETVNYTEILKTSQQLDKLIAEYMKNIKTNNKKLPYL